MAGSCAIACALRLAFLLRVRQTERDLPRPIPDLSSNAVISKLNGSLISNKKDEEVGTAGAGVIFVSDTLPPGSRSPC